MKKYSVILVAIAVMMLMGACTTQVTPDSASNNPTQQTAEIKSAFYNDEPSAFEMAMVGEYMLLDVRTQAEYDEGHINDPILIPVDELEARISEIAQYKDIPVLVYCRSGNRSQTASDILIKNGFTEVHNLVGGIGAWNQYKNKN